MAKISRAGGATINVVDSGFTDDTERIRAEAADRGIAAGDPEPEEPEVTEPDDDDDDDSTEEPEAADRPVLRPLPFNPGEYTVGDVQALLKDMDPADVELVLAAERQGLNRKTLVGE